MIKVYRVAVDISPEQEFGMPDDIAWAVENAVSGSICIVTGEEEPTTDDIKAFDDYDYSDIINEVRSIR